MILIAYYYLTVYIIRTMTTTSTCTVVDTVVLMTTYEQYSAALQVRARPRAVGAALLVLTPGLEFDSHHASRTRDATHPEFFPDSVSDCARRSLRPGGEVT